MHSRVIFWIKIPKNRSTFAANTPHSEKKVLLSQTQSFLDLTLYRLIFFGYSKIAFFGRILSDIYSMKFCNVSWRMNFSIFNKGEQFFFLFFFFRPIGVQYQWNKIIMHLTVRLLIQIPRFKSKFGANIPLLEKMEFSLSNLMQQRLLNFSFNWNFLLREGKFF